MKMNEVYECKIKLIGDPVNENDGDGVICKVINREVKLGKGVLVEVEVDRGKYYIPKNVVKEFLDRGSFKFDYFRKDLIQVNDVIHGCYL